MRIVRVEHSDPVRVDVVAEQHLSQRDREAEQTEREEEAARDEERDDVRDAKPLERAEVPPRAPELDRPKPPERPAVPPPR